MTELDNLTTLRKKLVSRRRMLVAAFQKTAPEQMSGESMTQIQSAIEAVDRAIEEERHPQLGARASSAGAMR